VEDNIWFEVSGDGFLYNMVRIMVGTLVDVGMGRIKAEEIPDIIESCDRKKAGRTAPPQGLYLVEVYYEQG
jgi:tRNA pseudouridine38-40 synthase